MKLSIIIPHYKELEMMISHLLTSLNEQVFVDFNDIEVIIINDGPESIELTSRFLDKFDNLNIIQKSNAFNAGVALTRNRGLLTSKGEYVMFCDSDDMFIRLDALYRMLQYADGKTQLIAAQWCYRDYWNENRSKVYLKSEYDATNIHCKMFLREFLTYYDLQFPDLRCHEDSYFMGCAFDLADVAKFISEPYYLYGDNEDSLTRQNKSAFMNSTWWMFHISVRMMLDKINKYHPEKIPWKVMQYSIYSYFEFNNPKKLVFSEEIKKAHDLFVDNIRTYEEQLLENTVDEVEKVYKETESWFGFVDLKESYRDFIKRILYE